MAEHHTKETETLGDEKDAKDEAESAAEKRREWLQKYFARALGISNEPPPESLLEEVTLEGVAKYIASDKCQKIVTMTGAGISTSAGIPDFRSPGTGLYANLEKYNLPNPQAIFSIDFLKSDPTAFFKLAKEREVLWFPIFKPTPCHYFLRLLNQKGKLLKHFTQNIDTLERVAGLDGDKIIEAHGSVHLSHCMECKKEYSQDWMKEEVFADRVPRCTKKDCGGIVKPDVVFFGEDLPKKFGENIHANPEDLEANCLSLRSFTTLLEECDLLIILGTSLVVQPFASLTNRVKANIPRLYINLEKMGNDSTHPLMVLMFGGGFNFDGEDNIRDVFWKGTCDDGCYALADYIGWGDELRNMVKDEHARLDKEMVAKDKTKAQASASCKPKGSIQASTSKNSPSSACKTSRSSESKTSSEVTSGTTSVSTTESCTDSASQFKTAASKAKAAASKMPTASTAKTSSTKVSSVTSGKSSRGSHTANITTSVPKSSTVRSVNSAKAKTDKKPM